MASVSDHARQRYVERVNPHARLKLKGDLVATVFGSRHFKAGTRKPYINGAN